MQDLHDLLCRRLHRPDLGILDRLLFLWLEFRVSHPAPNLFRRRLGFAQRFVDAGVAGKEVADIDAAALAEFAGVVCGWGVGDVAGGPDVGVGELVGLIASQLVYFAGLECGLRRQQVLLLSSPCRLAPRSNVLASWYLGVRCGTGGRTL